MPLVEVPAIDITGELTGKKGKKTTVKLTENRARLVQEKTKSIKSGNIISDAEAYRLATGNLNKPNQDICAGASVAIRNSKVQAALAYAVAKLHDTFTPEESAKLFKETIHECSAEKRQPLFETYYKALGGAYSREAQAPQQVNNTMINFYNE